jgi:hypothetical protein
MNWDQSVEVLEVFMKGCRTVREEDKDVSLLEPQVRKCARIRNVLPGADMKGFNWWVADGLPRIPVFGVHSQPICPHNFG